MFTVSLSYKERLCLKNKNTYIYTYIHILCLENMLTIHQTCTSIFMLKIIFHSFYKRSWNAASCLVIMLPDSVNLSLICHCLFFPFALALAQSMPKYVIQDDTQSHESVDTDSDSVHMCAQIAMQQFPGENCIPSTHVNASLPVAKAIHHLATWSKTITCIFNHNVRDRTETQAHV